ncbi:hypothetical protein [Psychrobacter sp.]|uniref:hypothetical protein n=1 Tax=Psychrobacter sp. TaxID=56811 RepID=UPI003C7157B4
MTSIIEQINIQEVAEHLQLLQAEFNKGGLLEQLRAKPLLDMEVNDGDITIFFELDRDTDLTVVFNTEYDRHTLTDISIRHVEVDSDEGVFEIDEGDHSALVLEGKRIIHDAVHYKMLDEDDAIETDFYHEVYA